MERHPDPAIVQLNVGDVGAAQGKSKDPHKGEGPQTSRPWALQTRLACLLAVGFGVRAFHRCSEGKSSLQEPWGYKLSPSAPE